MSIESLVSLGWGPFFEQQLDADVDGEAVPGRVVEQHRRRAEVDTGGQRRAVTGRGTLPPMTVGDWVTVDGSGAVTRVLERRSCFRRKAPGAGSQEQLLAANVDTAFIVCSLNEDFSLNRIERYLAVAHEAGAHPVVVLSKLDRCEEPEPLIASVRRLGSGLCVEAVNAREADSAAVLRPWCTAGSTAVLLGSSGAGKSTLTNALLGEAVQATGAVREDDDKGRHTTTRRSLLRLPGGGVIIDTPGIRELQLSECEAGVAQTFDDIAAAAAACRFADCRHQTEPGCAVREQVESGVIDARRLDNYRTLLREQAVNAESTAQRRSREKSTSRNYQKFQRDGRRFKQGED